MNGVRLTSRLPFQFPLFLVFRDAQGAFIGPDNGNRGIGTSWQPNSDEGDGILRCDHAVSL